MSARERVADLWDEVVANWRPGQDVWPGPLDDWFKSYRGRGSAAVDLDQYPDPWVGDLRGLVREPRVVVLGLNPGIGYEELQGPNGTWTKRVLDTGYSHCLHRSPPEDPAAWIPVHKRPSVYWVRVEHFARRWLGDTSAGHRDLLNFELYPWHSPKLTGGLASPPAIVREFVLDPVAEIAVPQVFAFGAAWFKVAAGLALPILASWETNRGDWPPEFTGWRVGVFGLPSGQQLVVSSQPGTGAPPSQAKVEALRVALWGLG